MFIVYSVGSDEENPFKVFTLAADAAKYAENRAKGDVERVFVYEWTGDFQEGLVAAREGRLQPRMHYPHREEPPVPPPEPPLVVPKSMQKTLQAIIGKVPRIARKH
jgi:hypothetical protein